MFSVDTEEQAEKLLILRCPRGPDGNFYARELAEEQSLENLEKFAKRLERGWALMQEKGAT